MKHSDVVIPDLPAYWLRRVRVPRCLLASAIPDAAPDAEGCCLLDIGIENERIVALTPGRSSHAGAPGAGDIDLEGRMVWPTLVDMHTHLDKGEVIYRVKPDGTLHGAARENLADQANWTEEDMTRRMNFGLRCAFVQGVSAIRTHLDYLRTGPERNWKVFQSLREEWKDRIALQGVGLASLDLFSTPAGERFADMIKDARGVMGGVTDMLGPLHGGVEKQSIDGLLDQFLEVAGDRGLDVDLHVDQTPDLDLFYLPHIAEAVIRTGFGGRVVVDHCVNLALQPEDVARRTIELCARAGLAFVTLPTPMMYLLDRTAGRTPRWRGVTLAHEIRAAGIPIALAGDNCRDYWYPYGDHDMVDIFRQGVRIFQLDHPVSETPAMVGPVPASIIGLKGTGSIGVGQEANLILFRARSLNEVLSRPQAERIVLHSGRRIMESLPEYEELDYPQAETGLIL
jgi:cytosine deaminase